MNFIIELDGVVFDVAGAHYEVHRRVAADVGWSNLDQPTFWRLTRTKGREAVLLPGARPVKIKDYWARFDELAESDQVVERFTPQPGIGDALAGLTRYGRCSAVTLGTNVDVRRRLLGRADLSSHFACVEGLNADPRLRPGELRSMGAGDDRTVVAASTDALLRAAGQADLTVVGVASGTCAVPRLTRAGTDIVYRSLGQLCDSIASGAHDLVRAGMLPLPLG